MKLHKYWDKLIKQNLYNSFINQNYHFSKSIQCQPIWMTNTKDNTSKDGTMDMVNWEWMME